MLQRPRSLERTHRRGEPQAAALSPGPLYYGHQSHSTHLSLPLFAWLRQETLAAGLGYEPRSLSCLSCVWVACQGTSQGNRADTTTSPRHRPGCLPPAEPALLRASETAVGAVLTRLIRWVVMLTRIQGTSFPPRRPAAGSSCLCLSPITFPLYPLCPRLRITRDHGFLCLTHCM